jgi:hypothetical protein
MTKADTTDTTADTPYDRPDPSPVEAPAKPAKKAAPKKAAPKPAPKPDPEPDGVDEGELTPEGVHEVLSGLERLVEHLIARVRSKFEGATVDAETDALLARVTNGMDAIGRVPEQ